MNIVNEVNLIIDELIFTLVPETIFHYHHQVTKYL